LSKLSTYNAGGRTENIFLLEPLGVGNLRY
jgi:hypothetical protein